MYTRNISERNLVLNVQNIVVFQVNILDYCFADNKLLMILLSLLLLVVVVVVAAVAVVVVVVVLVGP